tara:strand:+ start:117 stop:1421 length:1305 start_codon:yes stop_codon:yes gene_type:complete
MKTKSPFHKRSPLRSQMPTDRNGNIMYTPRPKSTSAPRTQQGAQTGGTLNMSGFPGSSGDGVGGGTTRAGRGRVSNPIGNTGTATGGAPRRANLQSGAGLPGSGSGSSAPTNSGEIINLDNSANVYSGNEGGQVINMMTAGMDPDGGGSAGGASGGGQLINMMMPSGGTIDTTGRGSVMDNVEPVTPASPQGEPLGETRPDTTQERIDQQLRASNEQRLAQGGTRGQPGDTAYTSQVNAITGQSPDAFNDEVTMAQETMGTNVVNSETTGGDGGIGPVVTTSSGERTANVATTGGGQADPTQSGFLDDDGNMGENVEIQSNTGGTTDTANPGTGPNDVEQSWVNDSGAVTMPDDMPIPGTGDTPTYNPLDTPKPDATPPPVVAQTTNVETATPPTGGANIPESVGGSDSVPDKIKESICDTNYQGDGILYDGLT